MTDDKNLNILEQCLANERHALQREEKILELAENDKIVLAQRLVFDSSVGTETHLDMLNEQIRELRKSLTEKSIKITELQKEIRNKRDAMI